jgi:hypothetical protein
MLIQEVSLQSAIPPSQLSFDVCAFLSDAIIPGWFFSSTFSSSGFTPTSILIELFGALAHPSISEQISSGVLLGLAGVDPTEGASTDADAILRSIPINKSLRLNHSVAVPFIPSEHLILHNGNLTSAHPEGVRLTAYHCVHPFMTQQFYASIVSSLPHDIGGSRLHFTEC